MNLYKNYRIATTQAGLTRGYFFILRIPPPTSCEYLDHSVRFSQSQGGIARHGYQKATLFWEQLTTGQAFKLRKRIQDALADTGYLYMTLNRSNGTGFDADWVDVRGIPQMPKFIADGRIAGSTGISIYNTEFILNNIVVLTAPAVFT